MSLVASAVPDLEAIRQQLAELAPPPRVAGGVLSTGIEALDRVLSDGGLPAGRLTEITGARGSGRTTLVRHLVATALAAHRWVAYVDGTRTLAPRDWAPLRDRRLWIVRPPDARHSAWCADVLLRSGAFGLVVLDGGPPLTRQIAVRLTRLARDHDVILIVARERAPDRSVPGRASHALLGSAVRLTVRRTSRGREPPAEAGGPGFRLALPASRSPALRVLQIQVDKGGTHHSVEVRCAIDVAHRLCAHPEVPDRRGVARRNRRGERAGPDVPGARPAAGPGVRGHVRRDDRRDGAGRDGRRGSTLPRQRRVAEPAPGRRTVRLAGR